MPRLVREDMLRVSLASAEIVDTNARGWDLDGNGTADMVEFWGKNGNLVLRAIDTDGNGSPEGIR